MDFSFKNLTGTKERTEIIFAKIDCIFTLNFINSEVKVLWKFKSTLNRQPQFFNMDTEQTTFIVASTDDGIFLNINDEIEDDIDMRYRIGLIKEIIYDEEDQMFYLLSNRMQEKLGFYVLKITKEHPERGQFLIRWKNKLDIGDANIYVMRNQEKGLKEIIISFKTIFINTYNVICMDISPKADLSLIFRHESFQLWESEIYGFITNKMSDFVMINREGINVISLGSTEKRPMKDGEGLDRMIHSLESVNYLKVEKSNSLYFACAKYETR